MTEIDFIHWPADLLPAQSSPFNPVPFSRSGGRSLGGIARHTRTDKGFWIGSLNGIAFRRGRQFEQAREWNKIRTFLNGQAGLIAVPVCSTRLFAAPPTWTDFSPNLLPHDDDTTFDDGTEYYEGRVEIRMAVYAAIGATTAVLRRVNAPTVEGIRFSYQHALYETGAAIEQVGIDEYRVPIFPAIRAAIPGGSWLEAERPTVLCRLASDSEMDIEFPPGNMPRPSVDFVEAVDVWNEIAGESPGFAPVLDGADGLDFRYINNSQYFPLIF